MNLGETNVACDTEMQHSGSERDCLKILVPLMLDLEYSLSLSLSLQMCVLFVCLFDCLFVCLLACLFVCSQNSHSRRTFF